MANLVWEIPLQNPRLRLEFTEHTFSVLLNVLHSVQSLNFRSQIISSIYYTVLTQSGINRSDDMLC